MSTKRRGNPNWTKGGASPNPQGRPRADAADAKPHDRAQAAADITLNKRDWMEIAYKNDGWYNVLTGHGTSTRDKSYGTRFCTDVMTEDEGRELWRGDDLAARAVEAIVDESLRAPFKVCIPDDAEGNDEEYGKELVDKIEQKWLNLDAFNALHEALCMERACNGSVIVLGADDGALSLEEPLNLARVKSFDWLTVLEPREVQPIQWYTNARAGKFGQVELYQLTPITQGVGKPGTTVSFAPVRIHESRLIVFRGIRTSRVNQYGQSTGFGDNIFTRAYRVLAQFNAAYSGAGILVHDFATPIFKIKGLADIIAKDNSQLFTARMQALALSMSTARAALIDAEEDYRRDTTNVTGLPDLMLEFCKRLAAAFNTPVSVLFGEAPGGLNASGAQGDQLQIWNNRCATFRSKKVIPALRRMTEIILATIGGAPDKWWIEGEPLYSPSAKEQAETEKVETETITALWDRGLLTTEQIVRNPEFAKRWGIAVADEPVVDPNAPEALALRTPGGAPTLPAAPGAPTAPVDPNAAPAPTAGGAASSNIQKEALNGAQVTSLVEVIKAVAAGDIPSNSAREILILAFQLDPTTADRMLPPVGFKSPSALAAESTPTPPPIASTPPKAE